MHDPMTQAFEIRNPLPWTWSRFPNGEVYAPPLITIWHVDPESDGTDDSCDWPHYKFSKEELNAALDLLDNPYDNMEVYLKGLRRSDQEALLIAQWTKARRFYAPRPWWKHPRYHFWHWKIDINPLFNLQRWLFTRCSKCGKRFPWGYAPISNGETNGPMWFKSEPGLFHHKCYESGYKSQ